LLRGREGGGAHREEEDERVIGRRRWTPASGRHIARRKNDRDPAIRGPYCCYQTNLVYFLRKVILKYTKVKIGPYITKENHPERIQERLINSSLN
jgi:hypothetical protein